MGIAKWVMSLDSGDIPGPDGINLLVWSENSAVRQAPAQWIHVLGGVNATAVIVDMAGNETTLTVTATVEVWEVEFKRIKSCSDSVELGTGSAPVASGGGGSYTPADGTKWTNPDPTTIAGALDTLAARTPPTGPVAGSYTPADGTKWADPDPGTIQAALDTLAARVPPTGAAAGAYTPTTPGDWPDPDPTTIGGALDKLAALPRNAAGSYAPADGTKWADPDPTTIQGALDRMAALLYTLNTNTAIP